MSDEPKNAYQSLLDLLRDPAMASYTDKQRAAWAELVFLCSPAACVGDDLRERHAWMEGWIQGQQAARHLLRLGELDRLLRRAELIISRWSEGATTHEQAQQRIKALMTDWLEDGKFRSEQEREHDTN